MSRVEPGKRQCGWREVYRLETVWTRFGILCMCVWVCVSGGGGVLYLSAFFKNVTVVVDHYINIHIVLVSDVQLQLLFQDRILEDAEYRSQCYTGNPCCVSITYVVVYI